MELFETLEAYLAPVMFGALAMGALAWVLKPTRLVVRLLGPATTPTAARIIVFAVMVVGPIVLALALELGVQTWIAVPLAITGAGLFCTFAGAERERFLDAGRTEMAGVLDQLSRCLRVGMSLEQSVELAAQSQSGPVSHALRLARHAAALGRDLPTVLAEQAARLRLPEFGALAALVVLHRETGGSLSERLTAQIVSTSRRRHAQSKLRLAAMQVTLQAKILLVFLAVLLGQMAFFEPRNLSFLLEPGAGRQMLAGSICLAASGWLTIWGLLRAAAR